MKHVETYGNIHYIDQLYREIVIGRSIPSMVMVERIAKALKIMNLFQFFVDNKTRKEAVTHKTVYNLKICSL